MADAPQPKEIPRGLIGYAVVRANFDQSAPSYIDNFLSFVLDVLAAGHPSALRETDIAERLRGQFGFSIPDRVVGKLLKRAISRDFVVGLGDRFRLVDAQVGQVRDLRAEITRFERQQNELLAKFADFVIERAPEAAEVYTTSELANYLLEFIERNAVPLLAAALRGDGALHDQWAGVQGRAYLVASFVEDISSRDSTGFAYLVEAVKGAMLASVLDLGTGDVRQKLGNVRLVLDTPIILKALGYQGEVQHRAVAQLLSLARRLEAKVICFDHTVQEVDGVLESAQAALRSLGRSPGALREVDAHFIDRGISPADIEIEKAHLEENLRTAGVAIVSKPDTYYQYGLDEPRLDALLQDVVGYKNNRTRRYDVDSLSAVHRLRRGSSPNDFMRCTAVLVTDNSRLVYASTKVDERHGWPLSMSDNDLAAILWARSPAGADDLPRRQLIATAYSWMQPSGHLWQKYLIEIEKLQENGKFSEDEALLLRAHPDARRALMDVTLGVEDDLGPDAVNTVAERVRSSLAEPFRADAEVSAAERDAAQRLADQMSRDSKEAASKLASVQQQNDQLVDEMAELKANVTGAAAAQGRALQNRAQRNAAAMVNWAIGLLMIIFVGLAGAKALEPKWIRGLPGWLAFAAGLAAAALLVLGLARHFVGGSVREWARPIERRLSRYLLRRYRARAGLPTEEV